MNLFPENKIAGILTPLFALRSEKGLGIGDVATLREFIVWAREIGFGVVQLLPINEVGRDNSPYNAISAMAIEPMTLHLAPGSPEELSREAFESTMANENLVTLRRGPVKYERVRTLKRELLEYAFKNFQLNATVDQQSVFEQFCERESNWLKQYSFFRVLMELNRGHNWWIPVYNWPAMRAEDFAWWRQRVRGVSRIFHIFRIDHVLGFYRIYAFPWRPKRNAEFLPLTHAQMLEKTGGRSPHFAPRDDETAENCEANKREGEEYLRMVLAESGATRVVGEDLGTVPRYVRPSLQSLSIAGFKIQQWEFLDGRMTPGKEFERLSVATYATHDHKPIRELWREMFDEKSPTREQAREDLLKIAQFAGTGPQEGLEYGRAVYPAIMSALFNSNP